MSTAPPMPNGKTPPAIFKYGKRSKQDEQFFSEATELYERNQGLLGDNWRNTSMEALAKLARQDFRAYMQLIKTTGIDMSYGKTASAMATACFDGSCVGRALTTDIHLRAFIMKDTEMGYLVDGSDRGFSTDPNASSRFYVIVTINLVSGEVLSVEKKGIQSVCVEGLCMAITMALNGATGLNVLPYAGVGEPKVEISRPFGQLKIDVSGSDAALAIAPDADFAVFLSTGYDAGGVPTYSGAVVGDGYPWLEGWAVDSLGRTQELFKITPTSSLFGIIGDPEYLLKVFP